MPENERTEPLAPGLPSVAPSADSHSVWPPSPTNSPAQAYAQNALPNFVSGGGLARAVVVLLLIEMGCYVLEMGTEPFHSNASRAVYGLAAVLDSLTSLGTGVCFLIWTYRCYKNLQSFGTQGLRSTPGWAVGYFFVPLMNLYKPYGIFSELWRASNPEVDSADPQQWKAVRPPALLGVWWLLWIVSNFVSAVYNLSANTGSSPGNLLDTVGVRVAASLISLLAAICAVWVVRSLTARQDAKWQTIPRASSLGL